MLKKLFFSMLLILSVSSYGQQTRPLEGFTKDDYLQKSIKQKKIGHIMLGGGAVLLLTGILIPRGEETGTTDIYPLLTVTDYKNDGIKTALAVTGILSMLGSVPFYIVSSKNKRRGMEVSLNNEKSVQIQNGAFVYKTIPSVKLKVRL